MTTPAESASEVLSLVGGHVDEELLKRNEDLAAENEILRTKIRGRVQLNDVERIRLAKLGKSWDAEVIRAWAAGILPDANGAPSAHPALNS